MYSAADIDKEDVKALLRKRGSSLAQVARELGVTRTAVSSVLARRFVSDRIQAAICQKAGLEPYLVFPDRYSPKN